MYRNLLRALTATALLTSFWSVFRLGGLTVFDLLSPLVALVAIPYRAHPKPTHSPRLRLPLAGIFAMVLAGLLSLIISSNAVEHLQRTSALLIAFCAMLAFAYLISRKQILSYTEVLVLLLISGTASSIAVILQGDFHVLTSIVPGHGSGTLQPWQRLTGLAEHPIEAGTVSAFAVVIAMALAIRAHQWLVYFLPILISIYSMRYSASLTAFLSLAVGICVICLYARAYWHLIGMVIAVTLIVASVSLGAMGTLMASRLQQFASDPNNYETVAFRETQVRETLSQITLTTILFGNGYSLAELPLGMEIHNTPIAALFHFGFLGLLSQCLIIVFFVRTLWGDASRHLKGALLACMVVFAGPYLTGPSLSRRSIWVPLLTLGALASSTQIQRRKRRSRLGVRSDAPITATNHDWSISAHRAI